MTQREKALKTAVYSKAKYSHLSPGAVSDAAKLKLWEIDNALSTLNAAKANPRAVGMTAKEIDNFTSQLTKERQWVAAYTIKPTAVEGQLRYDFSKINDVHIPGRIDITGKLIQIDQSLAELEQAKRNPAAFGLTKDDVKSLIGQLKDDRMMVADGYMEPSSVKLPVLPRGGVITSASGQSPYEHAARIRELNRRESFGRREKPVSASSNTEQDLRTRLSNAMKELGLPEDPKRLDQLVKSAEIFKQSTSNRIYVDHATGFRISIDENGTGKIDFTPHVMTSSGPAIAMDAGHGEAAASIGGDGIKGLQNIAVQIKAGLLKRPGALTGLTNPTMAGVAEKRLGFTTEINGDGKIVASGNFNHVETKVFSPEVMNLQKRLEARAAASGNLVPDALREPKPRLTITEADLNRPPVRPEGLNLGGDLLHGPNFMPDARNNVNFGLTAAKDSSQKQADQIAKAAVRQAKLEEPAGDLTRVVYHGSPHSFENFDQKIAAGLNNGVGNHTDAIFFADNPHIASGYSSPFQPGAPEGQGQVRMARLQLKNPFITSDTRYSGVISQQDIEELKAKGYDGIITKSALGENAGKEYVVFNTNQIHSPWATSSTSSKPANYDYLFGNDAEYHHALGGSHASEQPTITKAPETRVEYRPGDKVKVVRTNGLVDNGWEVVSKNSEGNYLVAKPQNGKFLTKTVTLADLETAQAHPAGVEVSGFSAKPEGLNVGGGLAPEQHFMPDVRGVHSTLGATTASEVGGVPKTSSRATLLESELGGPRVTSGGVVLPKGVMADASAMSGQAGGAVIQASPEQQIKVLNKEGKRLAKDLKAMMKSGKAGDPGVQEKMGEIRGRLNETTGKIRSLGGESSFKVPKTIEELNADARSLVKERDALYGELKAHPSGYDPHKLVRASQNLGEPNSDWRASRVHAINAQLENKAIELRNLGVPESDINFDFAKTKAFWANPYDRPLASTRFIGKVPILKQVKKAPHISTWSNSDRIGGNSPTKDWLNGESTDPHSKHLPGARDLARYGDGTVTAADEKVVNKAADSGTSKASRVTASSGESGPRPPANNEPKKPTVKLSAADNGSANSDPVKSRTNGGAVREPQAKEPKLATNGSSPAGETSMAGEATTGAEDAGRLARTGKTATSLAKGGLNLARTAGESLSTTGRSGAELASSAGSFLTDARAAAMATPVGEAVGETLGVAVGPEGLVVVPAAISSGKSMYKAGQDVAAGHWGQAGHELRINPYIGMGGPLTPGGMANLTDSAKNLAEGHYGAAARDFARSAGAYAVEDVAKQTYDGAVGLGKLVNQGANISESVSSAAHGHGIRAVDQLSHSTLANIGGAENPLGTELKMTDAGVHAIKDAGTNLIHGHPVAAAEAAFHDTAGAAWGSVKKTASDVGKGTVKIAEAPVNLAKNMAEGEYHAANDVVHGHPIAAAEDAFHGTVGAGWGATKDVVGGVGNMLGFGGGGPSDKKVSLGGGQTATFGPNQKPHKIIAELNKTQGPGWRPERSSDGKVDKFVRNLYDKKGRVTGTQIIDANAPATTHEGGLVIGQAGKGSEYKSAKAQKKEAAFHKAMNKALPSVAAMGEGHNSLLNQLGIKPKHQKSAKPKIAGPVAHAYGPYVPLPSIKPSYKPKDGHHTANGSRGPIGPQGPAGPHIPAGPVHHTQLHRSKATAGPTGPQGPTGPHMVAGPAGPSGPVGPIGPVHHTQHPTPPTHNKPATKSSGGLFGAFDNLGSGLSNVAKHVAKAEEKNISKTSKHSAKPTASTTSVPAYVYIPPPPPPPPPPPVVVQHASFSQPAHWQHHSMSQIASRDFGKDVIIDGREFYGVTINKFKDGATTYVDGNGKIIAYAGGGGSVAPKHQADNGVSVSIPHGDKSAGAGQNGNQNGNGGHSEGHAKAHLGIENKREAGTKGAPDLYSAKHSAPAIGGFSFTDKKGREVTITQTASGARLEQVAGSHAYRIGTGDAAPEAYKGGTIFKQGIIQSGPNKGKPFTITEMPDGSRYEQVAGGHAYETRPPVVAGGPSGGGTGGTVGGSTGNTTSGQGNNPDHGHGNHENNGAGGQTSGDGTVGTVGTGGNSNGGSVGGGNTANASSGNGGGNASSGNSGGAGFPPVYKDGKVFRQFIDSKGRPVTITEMPNGVHVEQALGGNAYQVKGPTPTAAQEQAAIEAFRKAETTPLNIGAQSATLLDKPNGALPAAQTTIMPDYTHSTLGKFKAQ